MRSFIALLALTGALLIAAGPASANVVSGSVSDPQGDAIHNYNELGQPLQPEDIARFGVAYDDLGAITFYMRFYPDTPGGFTPGMWSYGAQLGRYDKTTRSCNTSAPGVATLMLTINSDAPAPYGHDFRYSVAGEFADRGFVAMSPENSWHAFAPSQEVTRYDRVIDTALAGHRYNCVSGIYLRIGSITDTAKPFCMSPSGTIKCSRVGKKR